MTVELNKREIKLLKELDEWKGHYTIHWTQKTRESLVEKELAFVHGPHVSLTDAGREKLKMIRDLEAK